MQQSRCDSRGMKCHVCTESQGWPRWVDSSAGVSVEAQCATAYHRRTCSRNSLQSSSSGKAFYCQCSQRRCLRGSARPLARGDAVCSLLELRSVLPLLVWTPVAWAGDPLLKLSGPCVLRPSAYQALHFSQEKPFEHANL